ncbi:MAG: hypothetical protein C0402_13250 [Thermodesulfovibrio sp.]|nr:hypothetical protein [Thermodesulfovibrio sp.]
MLLLFAALGFLIYSNVLVDGIFVFDDFEYIVDNPMLKSLSVFSHINDPRHIGYLSFALNYAMGGEDPYGFHFINIVIHILNAVQVFAIVSILLHILRFEEARPELRQGAAFFAGLLFLVHPVETQAVAYITQRFTSLTAFFYLFSVMSYLYARRRIEEDRGAFLSYLLYAAGILSCILAMKTKEIAFTIPFIIAILEYMLFRDSALSHRRFTYLIPYMATLVIIPFSLLGPEYGLIGYGSGVDEITRRDKIFDLYQRSTYEYLINQFRVIVIYLRLLVLPVNQLAVYDLTASRSLFDMRVLGSLLLLLVLAGAAVYCWLKSLKADADNVPVYRMVSIGIIWFFVTLSIESSFIPIKDIIFEHRVYLPSVGFFAVFSVLCIRGAAHFFQGRSLYIKAAAVMLAIVIPLSIATYQRNFVWTDEVIFWDDIVQKTGKAIGYNNRGNAYAKKGMFELALKDLDKTITFFPRADDAMAWENTDFTPNNISKTYSARANIYAAMGDTERAKADFEMSRRVMFGR